MGSVALDASAVIAVLDGEDAHHGAAVEALGRAYDRREGLAMAASAYSEIMVHALRQGREEHVDALVDRLGIEVIGIDRGVARIAAELRAEHASLRLPDALVLATTRILGARLLSFDQRLLALAGGPGEGSGPESPQS